ncbi:MAG: T9SS C-terminal target domain-containing protein [Bacteroidetes bacterium]|nr:MAG: T9SS C-terminal target domain-containing protein [Bacteroidota bacterium]MBL1144569.1 T9SS C-terminal target domain-containing protein [Bacteroidota bacterium]NOG57364.1 T9SS type A sorting domain-containing protein [Bacteroidota bacterium]
MHKIIGIALLLLANINSYSQAPTVGLLKTDTSLAEYYTLFSPERNNHVYLINNCGEKLNEWTFSEFPGATCYLLNNGNLLRAGKDSLEIRDWNNNLIWSYAMDLNGYRQHHDIEPLPNGNILCLLTDRYTKAEAIAMGRDSNRIDAEFKLDKLIELQPQGTNGANLIWEWKYADHFIQDFDSTKANFGIVENHPELLDINYKTTHNSDYTHANGIDYNATLDQIIISARHLSEIHIIDHSTSSAEAASHMGGNSGKGGDFLWRWGNPAVYRQGTPSDQKLIGQHDSKWVEDGYLDAGKISVFNNDNDSNVHYSSVHLINPSIVNGQYSMANNMYLPSSYDWSFSGTVLGDTLFENRKSGAHSLPNGNFMVCQTSIGQFFEVDKSGNVLWVYKNPSGTSIAAQGSTNTNLNVVFRAEKYPSTHPAFIGKNMLSMGLIEDSNTLSDTCISVGINEQDFSLSFGIANPSTNGIIQFNSNYQFDRIELYHSNGQLIKKINHFNGNQIKISQELSGLYFLKVYANKQVGIKKVMFLK